MYYNMPAYMFVWLGSSGLKQAPGMGRGDGEQHMHFIALPPSACSAAQDAVQCSTVQTSWAKKPQATQKPRSQQHSQAWLNHRHSPHLPLLVLLLLLLLQGDD
jgi:hypothetical protein